MTETPKRVLVVGGSPARSSAKTIQRAADQCDVIVAVDRGLDAVLDAGLACTLFCGDADTVSSHGAQLVAQAEKSSLAGESASFDVEHYDPHKDATDLSLALRAICSRWPGAVLVATCFSGGAPDHAMAVMGRLASYGGPVEIIEDTFEARILHAGDAWTLVEKIGKRFSCVPLSVESEVSESGFRWNLNHASMELLSDWGISNVVEEDLACVTCHAGTLACWLFS